MLEFVKIEPHFCLHKAKNEEEDTMLSMLLRSLGVILHANSAFLIPYTVAAAAEVTTRALLTKEGQTRSTSIMD